ncbi:low molecular weight protein-tyrosine-phosphatase [Corynebacterium sp. L4756]|uniref:low molecular weight protein-tyrosine-phosphatase n=1 Tax=unclassified Corynebacterium TaxID=2624378 RepID=UPI00374DCEB7
MSDTFVSSSPASEEPSTELFHLCFVCTGNICRSPMAEVIIHDALEAAGLDSITRTSSCGLGGWHAGQKADKRTIAELRKSGHDGDSHRAAKLGKQHLGADIFIAMDHGHRDGLIHAGVEPEKIRLIREFDPHSPKGAEVADPYYGSQSDFQRTRQEIEAATPGLVEWVKDTATR